MINLRKLNNSKMDPETLELIKVREFNYWELNVHEDQAYLGRCILWSKLPGDRDFTEMIDEEKKEFWHGLERLKNALDKSFRPDRINYASFANTTNHLHIHIIPRYQSSRIFGGKIFTDFNCGRNYAPYLQNKVSNEMLIQIRDEIRSKL